MIRRSALAGLLTVVLVAMLTAQPAPAPHAGPAILVTRQLLDAQHLAVGQTVSLSANPSGTSAQPFRIVGVYEPVPDPMRLGVPRHEVRLHLPDLLGLSADPNDPLDGDSVDTINIAVPEKAQVAAVRRRLEASVPGAVVSANTGGQAQPFVVLEQFHYAIAIVTVLASSIFLLALMLMLVDERRATVGVLRLIGFRRRRIVSQVVVEGIVVALAGALFGVLLSVVLQSGVNQFFQWKYDTALVFVRITPAIALKSAAISVPLGVLATLVSSWSILRRDVFAITRR